MRKDPVSSQPMKNPYKKINRKHYSLGELVEIVSARDSKEALAALVDLFESGRVCVQNNGRLKRIKVGA